MMREHTRILGMATCRLTAWKRGRRRRRVDRIEPVRFTCGGSLSESPLPFHYNAVTASP